MSSPVIFLMGPTATGKTALALKLCQRLPLDIISVDSAMVYQGMDIGTAKPATDILKTFPHRLIDICDPAEIYSAARFRHDALKEIDAIHSSGRTPLLVGGTGLYFRALEQGISILPSANDDVRRRLEAEAKTMGWQKMHVRLQEIDPEAADRIHPNDPQRIQRALEVYEVTGMSMSELYARSTAKPLAASITKIILNPDDRGVIHERVKLRFMQMLQDGLVDEVRHLHGRGDLNANMPSMRMVGYRQIWNYLEGQIDYEDMVNSAIVATRQLAKRQLTWLRRETGANWLDSESETILDQVVGLIGENHNISARM